MTDLQKQKELLKYLRLRKILKTRESFWEYQKNSSPKDFNDARTYLICLSLTLQSFYQDRPIEYLADNPIDFHKRLDLSATTVDIEFEAKEDKTLIKVDCSGTDIIIIEVPRRHHKSHTLINFEDWVFGKDPKEIIITAAHNAELANEFSQYVRDGIEQVRFKATDIIYSDIFPKTSTKQGDRSKKRWALDGNYMSYAGSGILFPVVGKGGGLGVFDDIIRGPKEAFNENHREKVWMGYSTGWRACLEPPRKQIFVMTPWVEDDPGDRIQKESENTGEVVKVFNCTARSESQGILCEEILDERALNILEATMDPVIFSGNFLSKRVPLVGLLYKNFMTYEKPPIFKEYGFRCDTADEGDDFLCMILYGISMMDEPYLLDVLYTDDGQEITEPVAAKFLYDAKMKYGFISGKIEHNSGGGAFARAIDKIIKTPADGRFDEEGNKLTEIGTLPTNKIDIGTFTQTQNKLARIVTGASFVQKHIFFPVGWEQRWPQFSKAVKSYMRNGTSKFDDGPDTLTMVAEAVEDRFPTYEEMIQSVTANRSKHIQKPHFG